MSTREHGIVASVFYKKEDHGIWTISIGLDFEGSRQSFGGLCFGDGDPNEKPDEGQTLNGFELAKDFAADLCDLFGVDDLNKIKGRSCFALRCWPSFNTEIEGLEAFSGGKKVTLTGWRRKHYNAELAADPLARKSADLNRRLAMLARQIDETGEDLLKVAHGYVDWNKE